MAVFSCSNICLIRAGSVRLGEVAVHEVRNPDHISVSRVKRQGLPDDAYTWFFSRTCQEYRHGPSVS